MHINFDKLLTEQMWSTSSLINRRSRCQHKVPRIANHLHYCLNVSVRDLRRCHLCGTINSIVRDGSINSTVPIRSIIRGVVKPFKIKNLSDSPAGSSK